MLNTKVGELPRKTPRFIKLNDFRLSASKRKESVHDLQFTFLKSTLGSSTSTRGQKKILEISKCTM